jgi:hypothetical protein
VWRSIKCRSGLSGREFFDFFGSTRKTEPAPRVSLPLANREVGSFALLTIFPWITRFRSPLGVSDDGANRTRASSEMYYQRFLLAFRANRRQIQDRPTNQGHPPHRIPSSPLPVSPMRLFPFPYPADLRPAAGILIGK